MAVCLCVLVCVTPHLCCRFRAVLRLLPGASSSPTFPSPPFPSPPESDASVAALWSRPLPSSVVQPYLLTLCRSSTAGKPAETELGSQRTMQLCVTGGCCRFGAHISDCRRTGLNGNHVYTTPVLILQSGLCVIALYLRINDSVR